MTNDSLIEKLYAIKAPESCSPAERLLFGIAIQAAVETVKKHFPNLCKE